MDERHSVHQFRLLFIKQGMELLQLLAGVQVTLMNIVQGSHKQPVFMIPLSLIGEILLFPVVQVSGLFPFF